LSWDQLVAEEHELWEREAAGVADRDPACFAGSDDFDWLDVMFQPH
jgi:hypothetical protein